MRKRFQMINDADGNLTEELTSKTRNEAVQEALSEAGWHIVALEDEEDLDEDVLEFVCPSCQATRLESCENGSYTSPITVIHKDGEFEYGEIEGKWSYGQVSMFELWLCS